MHLHAERVMWVLLLLVALVGIGAWASDMQCVGTQLPTEGLCLLFGHRLSG